MTTFRDATGPAPGPGDGTVAAPLGPARRPLIAATKEVDPLAARLQARLDAFDAEHGSDGLGLRPRRTPWRGTALPATGDPVRAAIDDLNGQLELLCDQLERAFDDVDARIAAAHKDARAALDGVSDVVASVDRLAAELPHLLEDASDDDLRAIRAAVDRLKRRLRAPEQAP